MLVLVLVAEKDAVDVLPRVAEDVIVLELEAVLELVLLVELGIWFVVELVPLVF